MKYLVIVIAMTRMIIEESGGGWKKGWEDDWHHGGGRCLTGARRDEAIDTIKLAIIVLVIYKRITYNDRSWR